MKRIIALLFIVIFANLAIGQQSFADFQKTKQKKNEGTIKGTKEVSGSITTNNGFAPGFTIIFTFTIQVESPDFEYGDYVEMTFPSGMTPLDGSEEIGGGDAGGTELLNGVDGQTISWGDNDNSYGGLVSNVIYDFWVEVEVDASVSDDQDVDYYVSGDEYGGVEPHQFEGIVVIPELTTGPDLKSEAFGFILDYYSIPIGQAGFQPMGRVKNSGNALYDATDFSLSIGSFYDEDVAITVPMGPGATEEIAFPAISDAEVGTFTFTYHAEATDDENPENGTTEVEVEFHETDLRGHNNDIAGYQYIGTEDEPILGSVFYVNTEDVLTGVRFYVGGSTCELIHAVVYGFDETPSDLIATSFPVPITDPTGEYAVTFPMEVVLEEGYYLIGVVETNGDLNIAHTTDEFEYGSSWVYAGGEWSDVAAYEIYQTYYINGVFGEFTPPIFDVSVESITIPDYIEAGDVPVTGIVRNLSGEEDIVTELTLEYSVDGGTAISETFTDLSVGPFDTYEFSFSDPMNIMENGTYNVNISITDINGEGLDENPDNDVLDKDIILTSTTINNELSTNNVDIYPNPASDEVRISTEEVANVYIYNINGQLMMEKENVNGTYTMDVSNFNNGTYIVKVVSNNQTSTAKVNVMR